MYNILHLLVYIRSKTKFWRKRSRRKSFVVVGTRLVPDGPVAIRETCTMRGKSINKHSHVNTIHSRFLL
jgi:hypothetical protein